MSWRLKFFDWLHRQLIIVEDWPYSSTDFTDDLDPPLSEGEDWDEDQEKFILQDQELEIDVSDVYFITGLSWRGASPLLTSTRPCMENMSMVIERVCRGAWKGTVSG